jgi:hypothetical protein
MTQERQRFSLAAQSKNSAGNAEDEPVATELGREMGWFGRCECSEWTCHPNGLVHSLTLVATTFFRLLIHPLALAAANLSEASYRQRSKAPPHAPQPGGVSLQGDGF